MHFIQLQNGFVFHGRRLGLWLIQGLVLWLTLAWPVIALSAEPWLVLGDSLSAAYGIPKAAGWVSLLSQRLNEQGVTAEVVNASLSGETTSGGLQRLPRLLEKYQPTLVIIELGANDALRGQNLQAIERHLRLMISLCKESGAEVLLLGVRLPRNYGAAYEQRFTELYARLAKEQAILFDPFFIEEVALEPGMMQEDGLHPTALAQPYILERVWKQLQAVLSK